MQNDPCCGGLTLFEEAHEQLRHEKTPSLLHLHSEQQRGSSLLVHNVNVAPIKASVGTSVDNRKSLFIEKHPVVGLGVYDPTSCSAAERHIGAVVEPHISRSQYTEQSCHILKINNQDISMCVYVLAALVLRQTLVRLSKCLLVCIV